MLQEACLQGNLIAICLEQLNDPHPLLRQWVAICLGRIWQNFDSARWCGVRDSAHEKLYSLLSDPIPEVKTEFLLSRRQSSVFVSASKIWLLFLQGDANQTSPTRGASKGVQGELTEPPAPGSWALHSGNAMGFASLHIRSCSKCAPKTHRVLQKSPLVFLSKYENSSPPAHCANASLIGCALPVWPSQGRRDCAGLAVPDRAIRASTHTGTRS